MPSFAVRRTVDRTYSYFNEQYLNTGDGSTVKTYGYYSFTGTWNNSNVHDGNIAVAADCLGGYLDTHKTEFMLGFSAEDDDREYFWDVIGYSSTHDNARYFEDLYDFTYEEIYSPAEAWVAFDFAATAGGQSWHEYNERYWTPGQAGWTMRYYD